MIPAWLIGTTAKTFGSVISRFFEALWENPWKMMTILLTIYLIFCQLTHNGPLTKEGSCPESKTGDTISDIITKTVIFDSSKVALNVPKPAPISETIPAKRTWKRPVADIVSSSCRDSIGSLMSSLGWYDFSLSECEDRLQELSTVRTYRDSARNDSMVVGYGIVVQGELIGTPELWYKRTAPYVSTTRTITKVEVRGPYRKIGIGAGLGYINQGNKANPGGLETTLQTSYMDKKNNQVILRGGYIFQQQEGWTVGVEYIRNFNIKL